LSEGFYHEHLHYRRERRLGGVEGEPLPSAGGAGKFTPGGTKWRSQKCSQTQPLPVVFYSVYNCPLNSFIVGMQHTSVQNECFFVQANQNWMQQKFRIGLDNQNICAKLISG